MSERYSDSIVEEVAKEPTSESFFCPLLHQKKDSFLFKCRQVTDRSR